MANVLVGLVVCFLILAGWALADAVSRVHVHLLGDSLLKRTAGLVALLSGLLIGPTAEFTNHGGVQAQSSGEHAYFDALVARPDHWESFSLRSPAQLDYPKNGGYANANSGGLWVTYSPGTDTDPKRQDAAKVIIPAWAPTTAILAVPVDSTATMLQLSDLSGDVTKVPTSLNSKGRQLEIGDEVIVATEWPAPCPAHNAGCYPLDRTTGVLHVSRGQLGTTPASHAAGSGVMLANNNLINQIRLPLVTADGNTYLFTWDAYYTRSYMGSGLNNHKAFQFESNGLWLEPQTRFDGGATTASCFDPAVHVASLEARSYNKLGGGVDWAATDGNYLGPSVTKGEPILPKAGEFCMHPERWTRWWVRIEQRANDYDYMSMWVADEVQIPVQIYSSVPLSVEPNSSPVPNSIVKWWLEQNTSTDKLGGSRAVDFRDLVSYVRNFVALVNPPSDVSPLLLRPSAGEPLPPLPSGPKAPRNVRLMPGD